MTDREFLQARSTLLKRRIKEKSSKVQQELEQAVGPSMREHPRAGLLAGAMGGIALGSAAGVVRRSAGGLLSMLAGTGLYTLRLALVRSLLDGVENPDPTSSGATTTSSPSGSSSL